jgi:hypothetical protein
MNGNLQVTGILRLFLVVPDLDAAIAGWEQSGVGPWDLQDFSDQAVPEKYVDGQPVSYGMRLATCDALNVGLGLIQPIDDKSIFAAHLRVHGPGLHHVLATTAAGFDAALSAGQVLQNGQTASGIRFAHLDRREQLATIVEVFELPGGAS